MTKEKYLQAAKKSKMPRIKVGNFPRYADIWVVVVDEKVYCRQFSSNKSGWFAALRLDPNASIKINDTEFNVLGKIPDDIDEMADRINKAYIKKYGRSFSWLAIVARLMTLKKREARTIELEYYQ